MPLQSDSWASTINIAKKITSIMIEKDPDLYTTNMRLEKRKGKIFIDYYRNQKGATCICPYSLRLKNKATISCPIFWQELDLIKPYDITISNIDKRLKKRDPWKAFFD